MDVFLEKWSEYDPNAKGWIRPVDLAFLLYEIDHPLGYREVKQRKDGEEMKRKRKIRKIVKEDK